MEVIYATPWMLTRCIACSAKCTSIKAIVQSYLGCSYWLYSNRIAPKLSTRTLVTTSRGNIHPTSLTTMEATDTNALSMSPAGESEEEMVARHKRELRVTVNEHVDSTVP